MGNIDPLNDLSVAELDAGSRLLKTDLVNAIAADTMHKWAGLAIVAYLVAKRTDPAAQLATFRAMKSVELVTALGMVGDDEDDQAEVDEGQAAIDAAEAAAAPAPDPTAFTTPAADRAAALDRAVEASPTVPTPAPSSRVRGAVTR